MIYPGTVEPAVDNVSLDVQPGELVVLLGPSGCGKTTLLKMVNRLHEPSSGEIRIDGTSITSMSAPLLRRQIGYVIQQTGLFPHMRVEDNIAVVPKLQGWDRDQISERTDELLDLVGLPPKDYRRRYPSQLSGGEQQRVGLARAMAANPNTLLMDEPFGALDAITRNRLQDELIRIRSQIEQTILFVTHDIEEAVKLADRVVVMNAGKIVQYDEPLKIVTEPASQFVSDLVGAGDVLRRLSLMTAEHALEPLDGTTPNGAPRIPVTENLRTALSLLLTNQAQYLIVTGADEQPVGRLDLKSIEGLSTLPEIADPTVESGQ